MSPTDDLITILSLGLNRSFKQNIYWTHIIILAVCPGFFLSDWWDASYLYYYYVHLIIWLSARFCLHGTLVAGRVVAYISQFAFGFFFAVLFIVFVIVFCTRLRLLDRLRRAVWIPRLTMWFCVCQCPWSPTFPQSHVLEFLPHSVQFLVGDAVRTVDADSIVQERVVLQVPSNRNVPHHCNLQHPRWKVGEGGGNNAFD